MVKLGTEYNKDKRKTSFRKGKTLVELYGEERAKLIREAIRQKALEQFKDGMPEETKKKIGLTNSIVMKGNVNGFEKGYSPWNKDLTKETNFIIKEMGKKISVSGKGRIVSKETRKKISISNKGKPKSEKHKERIKIARAKQKIPIKDTSIEIKIQNFLKQLSIDFFTHQYIKEINHSYQCDILIPSMNLVIECDGDYWHKYPIGTEIDHIRTKELIKNGFKVLRLWEYEIKAMDINKFKERLENG
ncbi:MAG: DUF559 domain-containing protein [Ignavibacteriales bacterium]|nr:MAG: DUF559 domain-containing protein [Ignavibacteriales bacterium]